MHIAELIFLRSQTIFLQKIQIVCGIWFPGFSAFRMYACVIQFHCTVLHAIALLASARGLCLTRRLFTSCRKYIYVH